MPNFHDITEPDEFLPEPSTPLWIWALVALGVILIIGILIFIFKKKSTPNRTEILLDQAKKNLNHLRKKSKQLQPHELATQISLILRRYLEAAFHDPSLFETNEEFILRKSSLTQLPPDSRKSTTDFLTTLSNLKYAPQTSIDPEKLITEAETLITQSSNHAITESST